MEDELRANSCSPTPSTDTDIISQAPRVGRGETLDSLLESPHRHLFDPVSCGSSLSSPSLFSSRSLMDVDDAFPEGVYVPSAFDADQPSEPQIPVEFTDQVSIFKVLVIPEHLSNARTDSTTVPDLR
jgi:hypothetical protein